LAISTHPKIVVIGGGSGSSVVLRGLKKHTPNLTAIVTTFDSGGSSGILREEFGFLPFGDLRQCLVALSGDDLTGAAFAEAFDYRFSRDSSLNGHSIGNLLLAALTSVRNDVEGAVQEMSEILRVRGRVVPVALTLSDLCGELEDGTVIRGESAIDLRGKSNARIQRVYLDPPVRANPRAVQAVLEADAIVFGPGDLYTSIIPNLLADGLVDAIRQSSATRIYVSNLMTKPGETDGFSASHFAGEVFSYLGGSLLDWVLLDTRSLPEDVVSRYALEGATPVHADEDRVRLYTRKIFSGPISSASGKVRHNPDRLAEAVICAVQLSASEARRAGSRPASDLLATGTTGATLS
jgi:uncharacterized cofD-like protein